MNKKKCDVCKGLFRIRALQKSKKRLICKVCKKREEKEKGFVNMIDIAEEERALNKIKQVMKKDVKKIKTNEKETKFTEIPGSKVRKKYNRNLSHALSWDEKKFLLRKHMNLGASFEKAKEIVNQEKEFLSNYVKKMREKEKSEEEINRGFKEEFAKLCEK